MKIFLTAIVTQINNKNKNTVAVVKKIFFHNKINNYLCLDTAVLNN